MGDYRFSFMTMFCPRLYRGQEGGTESQEDYLIHPHLQSQLLGGRGWGTVTSSPARAIRETLIPTRYLETLTPALYLLSLPSMGTAQLYCTDIHAEKFTK